MTQQYQIAKLEGFEIKRLDHDIIEVVIEDHHHVDLESSKMLKSNLLKMQPDYNKLNLIIISGEFSTVSKEAREFASKSRINCNAEAVIVKSLYQRIIINFIVNFTKRFDSKRNMMCFKDRDSALDWIQKQKSKS